MWDTLWNMSSESTANISTGNPERPAAPVLAIVIPCYNEEAALRETSKAVRGHLDVMVAEHLISEQSCAILVDDGSKDATWSEIEAIHTALPNRFHGVKLAHNRGHQNALYAGLMDALRRNADISISMDADLQDDPDAMKEMIQKYQQGAEIVYGVRNSRATDTFFKRNTAHAFYGLMTSLGVESIPDHADYRLMSRTALQALSQYREVNLFLRGIVPSLGYKTDKVYYSRGERVAGESKYPLKKMIAFAIEGITSFSVTPLRLITIMGLLSVLVGLIMLIYTVCSVFTGHAVAGWGSIMCSLWILGGMILLSLGVVGEYIGRIYLEVKRRPRYIVERSI